jgi:long-chain acyl-CoA synthetase
MKKDEIFFEYPEFNNVKDIILYSVKKYPIHTAFIVKEKLEKSVKYNKISYTEFLDDVYKFGTGLYKLGLKGKKVGIISKNRYEWVVSYIACLFGGIIAVPFDKGLPNIELENSIYRSKIDAIIFDNSLLSEMQEIEKNNKSTIKEYICMEENENYKSFKSVMQDGQNIINQGNKEFINNKINDKDLAVLVFTSGTSSESKIVMLSQYNIAQNVSAMQLVEDFRDTDVNLAFLPFHHTFGSTGQIIMLSSGITTTFPDGLRHIGENLKEYGVTFFVGVPVLVEAIYKKVMASIEKQGKLKTVKIAKKLTNFLLKFHIDIRRKVFKTIINELGGLRFIISGAAGLDKEVEKGFNDLGILTIQGYGLTEASPVIAAENYKYRNYGSIGFAMPNVEIKIENKNELGIGELCAKGPNIMMGYYEDEQKTNEVLKDGWLHTGDLAYMDKDGFIFITGREKNMIVLRNGKKIFPEELEALVNKIDLVNECMVFGLPKEDDVVLSVKVKLDTEVIREKYADLSETEIEKTVWEKIKLINKTMPTYKYMKNLFIEKGEFIKTTTNKIKRNEEMKKILKENNL